MLELASILGIYRRHLVTGADDCSAVSVGLVGWHCSLDLRSLTLPLHTKRQRGAQLWPCYSLLLPLLPPDRQQQCAQLEVRLALPTHNAFHFLLPREPVLCDGCLWAAILDSSQCSGAMGWHYKTMGDLKDVSLLIHSQLPSSLSGWGNVGGTHGGHQTMSTSKMEFALTDPNQFHSLLASCRWAWADHSNV